jgi:hypothetical protein
LIAIFSPKRAAMMSDRLERGIIGEAGLALVPETIRNSMLEDADFLDAFSLSLRSEGIVSFSDGTRLRTITLFDAIAEADRTGSVVVICDEDAREWNVAFDTDDQGIRCPQLTREGNTFFYPEGALLLSYSAAREGQFKRMADDAGLPERHRERWINIIRERALSNNEMGQIHRDLEDTPHRLMRRLRESLRSGKTLHDLFVPEGRQYYERLIGDLGDAKDVQEHAGSGAKELVTELTRWDPRKGFALALPLASQSAYCAAIPVADLPEEVVSEVYDALISNGDMLSRLAAVEIGLPLLLKLPWLAEPISELVNIIRTEDPEAGDDAFSDLARYFILAESEISRSGVLRGVPYFYRRAASFAQASLIQRQLNVVGADPTDFRKWIDQNYGPQFYAQSLVDMRLAPRWHPELIHAGQLKQEFIGRILGAAEANRERLGEGRLAELLHPSSEHKDRLISAAEFPRPYFPGPLEGSLPPPQDLPSEARVAIDEQLSDPQLSTKSFVAAINLANIYVIQEELASRISERIRGGKYHFREIRSEGELSAALCGLGVIAAVTRSHELANDLRILVRRYRRDTTRVISISAAIRTIFFAAAAFEDLESWCGFLGDAVEELAVGSLSKDEAVTLRGLVLRTCEVEPELWTRIGPAESALESFLSS